MCIAASMVREIVFAKVEQYFTVTEERSHLDTAVALCRISGKNAVIVCGSGFKGLEIMQHEACGQGWKAELDAACCTMRLSVGQMTITVVAEIDAPESTPLTTYYGKKQPTQEALGETAPEGNRATQEDQTSGSDIHDSKGKGKCRKGLSKGQGKGRGSMGKGGQAYPMVQRSYVGEGGNSVAGAAQPQSTQDEPPTPATVRLPIDLVDIEMIVVVDGHLLRETASLSTVLHRVCSRGISRQALPVFHVVTDLRQVFLEDADQLAAISSKISVDGLVTTMVELAGQACVPNGAAIGAAGLPALDALPAVVNFKLRLPSLGLITRLRERYGCTISEVFYNVLEGLLKSEESEKICRAGQ